MQIKKVTVTPKKAELWLRHNESNRRLSKSTVDYYARIMDRGEWGECPQPIVRNGKGLLDGQHRLHAVIKHGKPVPMWVASGATEATRRVVDRGRGRSLGDTLQMEHGLKYATHVAAAAKAMVTYDTGARVRLTADEVLEIVSKRKASFAWMTKALSNAKRGFYGAYLLSPLVWVHKKYPEQVEEFYEKLKTGENLTRNSPIMRLRDRLMTRGEIEGSTSLNTLSLAVFSTLDAFISGEDMKTLRTSAAGFQRFRKEFKRPAKADMWASKAMQTHRYRRNRK